MNPALIAKPRRPRPTLSNVLPSLRATARERLKTGDVFGFFSTTDSMLSMRLLCDNYYYLKSVGLWEKALLYAWSNQKYTGGPIHNDQDDSWAVLMPAILAASNRAKLLEFSDDLPDGDEFTIYRGARAEYARGVSWTLALNIAANFPTLWSEASNIYATKIKRSDIYAYIDSGDSRNEKEVVVVLPKEHPITILQ